MEMSAEGVGLAKRPFLIYTRNKKALFRGPKFAESKVISYLPRSAYLSAVSFWLWLPLGRPEFFWPRNAYLVNDRSDVSIIDHFWEKFNFFEKKYNGRLKNAHRMAHKFEKIRTK